MRTPWLRAGAVLALVLALDQFTKGLVRHGIEPGDSRRVTSFLELVHVRNNGVAFGQFAGGGIVVVVIVAGALAALVYYFTTNVDRPLSWLPTGLLLGGAVGNVADRVRLGAVTDFIKFPSWPAFNLADSAITVGVVILIVVIERAPDRDGS